MIFWQIHSDFCWNFNFEGMDLRSCVGVWVEIKSIYTEKINRDEWSRGGLFKPDYNCVELRDSKKKSKKLIKNKLKNAPVSSLKNLIFII